MQMCQFFVSLDSSARWVLPGLDDELVVQRRRCGVHRPECTESCILCTPFVRSTVYGVQDAEGRKMKQEQVVQVVGGVGGLEPTRGRDRGWVPHGPSLRTSCLRSHSARVVTCQVPEARSGLKVGVARRTVALVLIRH